MNEVDFLQNQKRKQKHFLKKNFHFNECFSSHLSEKIRKKICTEFHYMKNEILKCTSKKWPKRMNASIAQESSERWHTSDIIAILIQYIVHMIAFWHEHDWKIGHEIFLHIHLLVLYIGYTRKALEKAIFDRLWDHGHWGGGNTSHNEHHQSFRVL